MIIGGDFSTVNGAARARIARLDADGATDPTFGNGLTGVNAFVLALAVQPDGKVVIGGSFSTVNGTARNRITRLNADGTTDTGFVNGLSGANGFVRAIAIQPDGKVVTGGDFTTMNGVARIRIARLNADGQTDATFGNDLATGADNFVLAIALQPDGKVVIGGGFTQINGTARNGIARLNADGTLDTGFGNGLTGANNPVGAIALQPDGKLVIGGDFSTVNGIARNRIARLNADGTTDETFGNGLTGANNSVATVSIQPDGKVVIGGQFTQVNGTARGGIARLNADGTLDTGFGNGLTGANASVRAVSIQPDGKAVIGGLFTTVNDSERGRIARLVGDSCTTFTLNPTSANVAVTGGTGTVGVTASNAGCPWTATSNDTWLTITGGATGTGNGTVAYAVAVNSGTARIGTLTIAGQTFSVSQEGCISPTAFNVTGGGSFCSGGTGVAVGLSGSQTGVNYQLFNGASPVGSQVAGTGSALSFGNQTTAGTYTVVATTGGCTSNMTGSVVVTVTNCTPTVTTNPANGVSPTGATLNGLVNANGSGTTVVFRYGTTSGGPYPLSIAATPSPVTGTAAVSATLTGLMTNQMYYFVVEGSNVSGTAQGTEQSFSTATCTFELSATSASFPASGGNGSVTLTTTTGCAWTVSGLPEWIVNVTPSNGTATTAMTYTVNPNLSQNPRSATLTIGGQSYDVTQAPSVAVNSSIGLAITGQTVLPTSCAPNYANDYVITATVTNTGSQPIYNPHLRVLELQEAAGSGPPAVPFRLLTADDANCATGGLTGAIQSTDGQTTPATLPTLAPGQSVTVRLVIALPSLRRFRFVFGVDGGFTAPVAMKYRKANFAPTFTLARHTEPSTGTAFVFIPGADGKTMEIVPVQPELEAFLNLGDGFWADLNRTLEPHRGNR